MVALFVIFAVVFFLTIDLILAARGQATLAQRLMARQEAAAAERPLVAGFELAPDRGYHPGHTWARYHGDATARIGVDEFAARLVGTPDAVDLPAVGTQVRAGRPMARFTRRGRRTSLVAPISGVVTAINRKVMEQPDQLSNEPYGEGWLVEVKGDSLRLDLRALLSGELARRWMDESVASLHRVFTPDGAAVAADGGRPADGIGDMLDDGAWDRVRSRFLLTDND